VSTTTITHRDTVTVVQTAPPTVVKVNVGRVGPRGPAGEQGLQGAQGEAGEQGPPGDPGPAGVDGRTILSGAGAPSSGLGENGDFYLDTAASRLYGPKTAGAWGSGVSLIGPQGIQGPVGPDGPQGQAGATGATGSQGPAGPNLTFAESQWTFVAFIGGTNGFPWTGAAVNGGSVTSILGPTQSPGAARCSSSGSANSGYRFVTPTSYQGKSGLAFRILALVYANANTTHRFGYHDTTTKAAPTDGVFFEVVDLTVTAKVRNNTSETPAGASAVLSNGTYYVWDIDYTADDAVRFVIWELVSGNKVYDQTISGANVPNLTTRVFNHALVSTNSTGGSTALMDLALMGGGPARPNYCPVPA